MPASTRARNTTIVDLIVKARNELFLHLVNVAAARPARSIDLLLYTDGSQTQAKPPS
jgi:hypothetical protein